MRDHVAVRVTSQASLRLEANTPEHERRAVLERMRVDPDADTKAHPSGSCRARRPSNTVIVS